MARRSERDPTAIPVDEALTLVVGWKTADGYDLGRVELHESVAEDLREACRDVVEKLASRQPKAYGPDALIAQEEYLVVPERILEPDLTIAGPLRRAAGLDSIGARDLPTRPLALYSVVVGDQTDQRWAFVRKSNPAKVARPGRIVATLGNTLTRVRAPVFVFDYWFDLVLLPAGAFVLNQIAFNLLFRDVAVLARRRSAWVADIAARLPFADDGAERLAEAAQADSRLWSRLRSIHERGHLADVTIDDVRRYARRQGIDVTRMIQDNQLVYDLTNRFDLLKLLNEDLFLGGLTGEPFEGEVSNTHMERRNMG
jgi:hypothetical protein